MESWLNVPPVVPHSEVAKHLSTMDFTEFQKTMARFGKRIRIFGEMLREKRLNRLGISTGTAPGPFPGSIDIDVGPVRPPSL